MCPRDAEVTQAGPWSEGHLGSSEWGWSGPVHPKSPCSAHPLPPALCGGRGSSRGSGRGLGKRQPPRQLSKHKGDQSRRKHDCERKLGHLIPAADGSGRRSQEPDQEPITEVRRGANVSDGDPAQRPPSLQSLGEGLLPFPQAGNKTTW